jgi:hypothetical protein
MVNSFRAEGGILLEGCRWLLNGAEKLTVVQRI